MIMPAMVLDTDILSAVTAKAKLYLAQHGRFTFSIITRYEILRGLNAKRAIKQLDSFNRLCERSFILSISDEVIVTASEIYADLHHRGELVGDADILIAATAMVNGLQVVTNNEGHFRRINGLNLENWLRPE